MINVPRCMSTQHPDNATVPFFAASSVLVGEDEIREAFYAYSHLGCDEQMWDVEGKEIDTYVVRKLFSFYEEFFRQNTLGEDLRLTLRVPNPAVEGSESKVLLETLESIRPSYDAARLFYGREVAPIFEVILPRTPAIWRSCGASARRWRATRQPRWAICCCERRCCGVFLARFGVAHARSAGTPR